MRLASSFSTARAQEAQASVRVPVAVWRLALLPLRRARRPLSGAERRARPSSRRGGEERRGG
eukprot:3982458-Pyramimonas_sp.AAC.1